MPSKASGPAALSPTARRPAALRRVALTQVAAAAAILLVLVSSGCVTRPTLQLGSRGTAVVSLQQRLTQLQYDLGSTDGVFGDGTLHAVVAFQKVNGLNRDGVVGAGTWAALDHPFIPRARYNPVVGGRHVTGLEIDLSRQVLYLTYQGAGDPHHRRLHR